jgi:hypothetical protein
MVCSLSALTRCNARVARHSKMRGVPVLMRRERAVPVYGRRSGACRGQGHALAGGHSRRTECDDDAVASTCGDGLRIANCGRENIRKCCGSCEVRAPSVSVSGNHTLGNIEVRGSGLAEALEVRQSVERNSCFICEDERRRIMRRGEHGGGCLFEHRHLRSSG